MTRFIPMRTFAAVAAIGLFAFCASGWANAQSLSVSPVNVQLAPGETATAITVENMSDRAAAFQLRVFDWAEKDGEDSLSPTGAIVASPPIGTVEAGGTQVIRVVLRRKPVSREETYRIWLDEIPPTDSPRAVRIALRLSIPVFAEPDTRAIPDLHWSLVREGGEIYLVAANAGTRHETVRKLIVKGPDGNVLATDGNISPHILAGSERRWHIAGLRRAASDGMVVQVTAETDSGSSSQSVGFASRNP